MSNENRNTPIRKHIRQKKILRTPFNHHLGAMINVKPMWYPRMVPSYLWLGCVFNSKTREEAFYLCRSVFKEFFELEGVLKSDKYVPLTHEHLNSIKRNGAQRMIDRFATAPDIRSNFDALSIFPKFPGRTKFSAYFTEDKSHNAFDEKVLKLKFVVSEISGQDSQSATDIAWFLKAMLMATKQVKMPRDIAERTIDWINAYPESDDYNEFGGSFRAFRNSLYSWNDEKVGEDWTPWQERFWTWNWNNTDCEHTSININPDLQESLYVAASRLSEHVVNGMASYLTKCDNNYQTEDDRLKYEILSSKFFQLSECLLSLFRDINILSTVGFTSLRVMFEIYISMKYLINTERFSEFVEYGAGKMKLIAEKDLASEFFNDAMFCDVSALANEEIHERFRDIDLGSFYKKSMRDIAIEVDEKELYDAIYDVTSVFVHSEWPALRNRYLTVCENPLHRFHRLPVMNIRINIPGTVLGVRVYNSFVSEFLEGIVEEIEIPDELKVFKDRAYYTAEL